MGATVDSLLYTVDELTWMCNDDAKKMFLNISLHLDFQPYCGVDLLVPYPEEASHGSI